MHNWSSVVWALAWAVLFLITVVGCCRSVAGHIRRDGVDAESTSRAL
jgi:hypothetical protein